MSQIGKILTENLRSVFTFRAAIVLGMVTEAWFLLNNLISATGRKGVYGLLHIDTKAVAAVTLSRLFSFGHQLALIAVLFLLLWLLENYRRERMARSLATAFKEGLLTQHEFRRKELDLQRDEILRHIHLLAWNGILSPNNTTETRKIILESFKRQALREALMEAKASGAIDNETYEGSLARLG